MPLWHVSKPLQRLPSSQLVPLDLLLTGQIPVDGTQAPTVVQTVAIGQTTGTPAVQTPLWHVSRPLQRLPSSQFVPFDLFVYLQPITGSQVLVRQGKGSQSGGIPAVQTPFWHVSIPLQRLPSAQLVPLDLLVTGQTPVAGTQAPTVVQAVSDGQVTGTPGVQTPVWHVSRPLQRLASAQLDPFALFDQALVLSAVLHT
jgi:hypothetical protein